ncbi:ATP-binding cassette domain-containing protein, partial [Oenococcus oeni]
MIKINNLTKKYKDKLVLDKVNLQIPSNKISFFVGKNGSGKTTLIDILAGLNKINHGSIQIDNKDARIPYSKSLRKKIFSLPVENISVEYLTAKENLLYYSELFKLKLSDRKIKDIL